MDRNARKNLEALAEEEDEEEVEVGRATDDSETETESEDEESGVRRGEPNKFDGLCDGLLNAMALVHSALKELLDFKDELLQHSLPPTVLIHLAMTSSKLFRSVSDLSMPANELVRLVRVYSTPWEEKSAALKKLHEDYESKQRQLNIAIKRLQLVDAHSKRIAREKRVMNWEKLFAKLTSTKGHGRRWKFLIETIKQKAKMGLEHVNAYTQALEESMDSEDEDVPTQAPTTRTEVGDAVSENQESEDFDEGDQESRGGDDAKSGSRADDEDDDGDDDGDDEGDEDKAGDAEDSDSEESGAKFSSGDVPTVTINIAPRESDDESESVFSRTGSPKKVRFEEEKAQVVKPPMKDSEAWTGEPDYDRSLFVRIFCPEGLEQTQIRCTLTCDGQIFKTGILDDDEQDGEEVEEVDQPAKRPRAAHGATGKRTTPEEPQPPQSEGGVKKSKKFKEFELKLPDEVPEGTIKLGRPKEEPANLQIAIHHGQYEELFAMATIDFQDVKELSLQTIYLPPPHGDDEVLHNRSGSLSDTGDLDSLSDSIDLMLADDASDAQGTQTVKRDDPAKDIDALPFPLYSLHAGKSDSLHKPCGTLPLVLYWGKRERPRVFNRQAGTLGVYDLVYDLTGIDLSTTSKEDLHKKTVDRSASAITFTPEIEEETVLKTEYDRLVVSHQEELQYLQEEYEKRLAELMQSLELMQEENVALSQQQQQAILRPLSAGSRGSRVSRGSTSPGPVTFHSPVVPKKPTPQTVSMEKTVSDVTRGGDRSTIPDTASSGMRPVPPKSQRSQKNFRIGRPLPKWGEHLPQDFFERLRLFEEESKMHKQELNERTLRDIKESLEKKLAGQHKLSKREEQMYDALKDVSLPALFMPVRTGNIFNPRAHQYFHPTGTTDVRLTQPPSVFQLPPLPHNNKVSVVNLFELSKNFHNRGPDWLVERYIQQQQPLSSINTYPQTPAPTTSIQQQASAQRSPQAERESQATGSAIDDSHSGRPLSMPEQEVDA